MLNIKNNINQKIDLANEQGMSQVFGLAAQQHHNAFIKFYDMISLLKPARILEIGTALGGFTEFLYLITKDLEINCKILSYDINEHPWYKDIINKGVDIRVENIFFNNYTEINPFVIDFIQQEGLTIVLCDGGNKIQEFNILSTYLKNNDIIMAHDYAISNEYFNSNIKNKTFTI